MNYKIKGGIVILAFLLPAMIFFKRGFTQLHKGRQYRIDNIEGQVESKKGYLPVVFHSITAKSAGRVKSIVHSENMSSALIGGHNSIFHEEDAIRGATIVKIHKDKVEFAKNDHKWSQKVGETPIEEWYR
jgi:hypothetical protein